MSESENDFPTGPRAGDRNTTFFDDPIQDHLLRALVTATMELSVTRDRLASLEAQLAEAGALDKLALDTFQPSMEQAQQREAERQKLIQDVLGPLVSKLSE